MLPALTPTPLQAASEPVDHREQLTCAGGSASSRLSSMRHDGRAPRDRALSVGKD